MWLEIQLESIELICMWLSIAYGWLNGMGYFEWVDISDMKCWVFHLDNLGLGWHVIRGDRDRVLGKHPKPLRIKNKLMCESIDWNEMI